MKAVIIEDEKDIAKGMQEVMKQLSERFDGLEAFDNAEDALNYIEVQQPDIIVTDIVLPRMSGIEMIEHIQTAAYHPKIIIVSGYDNFSYAQRGIKLGVQDYILKPFDNAQFRSVIVGMLEAIDKERSDSLLRNPEVSALGTKALRDKFLHGLCLKPTALQEHVYHRLKFWSLEWLTETKYAVVLIDFAHKSASPYPEKEAELKSFAVGNIVEELIRSYPPSVLFKNSLNQWCLIAGRRDIDEMADLIADNILRFQKYKVYMGISELTNAFQSLSAAYEQAVEALHICTLNGRSNRQYYRELAPETGSSDEDITASMIRYMMAMNQTEIEPAIGTLLKGFALQGGRKKMGGLIKASLDWLSRLHETLAVRTEASIPPVSLALWDAMEQCSSIEELQQCIAEHLRSLADRISADRSHYLIERAKTLIKQRFSEDLTLYSIAETLSIHHVWLSQLFKRECGINFVDYLADVRIEEAKKLLRKSELKVYEIVRAVGYQDLQHFGQIFKKKTGLSPKEYRFGK